MTVARYESAIDLASITAVDMHVHLYCYRVRGIIECVMISYSRMAVPGLGVGIQPE